MKFADNSEALRHAARADNTRIAYEKGWWAFASWCGRAGIKPRLATTDDVIKFLVEMAGERPGSANPLSLNTLRLYRSAINDRFRRERDTSPAADKSVDEVLQGLARLRGDKPRRVKAIREHQLIAMLDACGWGLHGRRDAALLSLGFAAALRRSELCNLCVDDLQRKTSEGMIVHIRRSKTDQSGRGQSVAVIDGKSIKPITHVERWLHAAGISQGFVFQTLRAEGRPSGTAIDHGEVARVVKRYAARIGLNPDEYSGHSLRAGFVTSAAAHHARIDKIMEVTRHRNAETLMNYIRDENTFVDHAGRGFM